MTDVYDEDEAVYADEFREPEPEPPSRPVRAVKMATPVPLAEVETPNTLHGEVKFTRSVALTGGRNGDMAHLSVTLPFAVQPGMDLPTVAALASDVFFQAKAVVFEQAGIEFTYDEGGIIHEVIKRHFPGAETSEAPRRASRDDEDDDEDFPRPRAMEKPAHIKTAVWRDLCDNPGDYYDNRAAKASGKYKATSPDFKHRETGEGIWLRPPRRSA